MENLSQPTAEPSLTVLLGGIVNDAKELLMQEVALTKLKVQDEVRKAKTAAISLGIGLGIVAVGGTLLSVMLVQVLAVFMELPLWGCYGLVGSGLVVLGGMVLTVGKTTAEALDGVPQPTVETRKENGQWRTAQTTSDRT
jgi:hypothetical protein